MQGVDSRAGMRGGWWTGAPLVFVAGSAVQLAQPELWRWTTYAGCLAMAFALGSVARRIAAHRLGARMAMGIVVLGLVGFGGTGWRAAHFHHQAINPALEGRDLLLTGVVVAMPQVESYGMRLRFEVEAARDADGPVQLPRRLSLGWYLNAAGNDDVYNVDAGSSAPLVKAGERWRLGARLRAPHGTLNPFGFDQELWAWEQGLQASGSVRPGPSGESPERLDQTWRHPVELARQSVRDRVLAVLREHPRAAGWIAALVVGDQNAIPQADWDLFRATGVAHLMSISGLHITMFAWLAVAVVGALWRRSALLCLRLPAPQAALIGGCLLALAYALFSGWGVPAQRTVCMLWVMSGLRLTGRSWPWPIVWAWACAAVVLWDPWAVLQAGFWLSFVAVGVLFASGSEATRADRPGLKARLRAAWHEQWVVTLALAPLSLLLFGQVSVVGLVANALAIPWVTLVVTPLGLLGVVWSPLWKLGAWTVEWMAVALQWLASWPLSQLTLPMAPPVLGIVAVLGGVLLTLRLPPSWRLAGVPLILPVLLWQAPRPDEGHFELLAVDVGQGSAVLVRTAHHALLYDTGPAYATGDDAGRGILVPLLRALDERLDMLVVSHGDLDHAGGAPAVLAAQPDSGFRGSVPLGHPLWALRPGVRCEVGQHWEWDGVLFDMLHPRAADDAVRSRPNALSCVLRIRARPAVAGGPVAGALLAGDIEAPTENLLVQAGTDLRADVLLVPHHGSKTSSSGAFLDAVQPRLAVIQAGYRNRFGHPAVAPLARLQARGVQVVDTVHCGAITWRSDDAGRTGCLRADAPRYWRHHVP